MANVKITDLTAKNATAGDDLLLLVDSEDSNREKKVKISDFESSTDYLTDVSITKADPSLTLISNETAVDGNEAGRIDFKGLNDATTPEEITYGSIGFEANDVTNGTEDGYFVVKSVFSGDETNILTIDHLRNVEIGQGASSFGINATSIGFNATAHYGGIAIGEDSEAITDSTIVAPIAIGRNASANFYRAIALGINADAGDINASAIGPESDAGGAGSTALGYNAQAPTDGTVVLGTSSNSVHVPGSIRIGGIASANQMEEYEDGFWTPTFTTLDPDEQPTQEFSYYTILGDVAVISARITFGTVTDTSNAIIGGLPASVATIFGSTGVYRLDSSTSFSTGVVHGNNADDLVFLDNDSSSSTDVKTWASFSGKTLSFTYTYH